MSELAKYRWELSIYNSYRDVEDNTPKFLRQFETKEALNFYFSDYILRSGSKTEYYQVSITRIEHAIQNESS